MPLKTVVAPVHRCYYVPLGAALAFSKIVEPQKVVSASDLYGTIFGTQGVAVQPVNLTTTQFSRPAFVSVTADGRPRQHSALLTAWLVRGFFHRASRGEKTGAQIV